MASEDAGIRRGKQSKPREAGVDVHMFCRLECDVRLSRKMIGLIPGTEQSLPGGHSGGICGL